MKSKVILISPNLYSLYSICVAEELRLRNIEIAGIVCVKVFNLSRILRESKRDGFKWIFSKFIRKVLLRDKVHDHHSFETLSQRKQKLSLRDSSLRSWSQRNKIEFFSCQSLNDPKLMKHLDRWSPKLSVFTGGGLIRQDFIERSGLGVLNCHAGILPNYRGMNVVEWPILENQPELIGITSHLMDSGIDTGPILKVLPIPFKSFESFEILRERFRVIMVDHLVQSAVDLLSGKITPQPQELQDGKQYFVMHSRLLKLAQEKLGSYGVSSKKWEDSRSKLQSQSS